MVRSTKAVRLVTVSLLPTAKLLNCARLEVVCRAATPRSVVTMWTMTAMVRSTKVASLFAKRVTRALAIRGSSNTEVSGVAEKENRLV